MRCAITERRGAVWVLWATSPGVCLNMKRDDFENGNTMNTDQALFVFASPLNSIATAVLNNTAVDIAFPTSASFTASMIVVFRQRLLVEEVIRRYERRPR
jgi:hypothetical protein